MGFPIYIETISMELPNLYFKGFLVKISVLISVPEDCFILANSEDPDEMLPYAAFHLGPNCFQSTCLPVSRKKWIKK